MDYQIFFLGTLVTGSLASHAIVLPRSLQAQVKPDVFLEGESSQVRTVSPQEQIIEGGAARENSLLHSFEQFNVGENQTVNFANPENISNIFGRVTGGDISQILGNLGVLGEANLWLLNPNGFIFGENASLNLSGSFVATTAESINFADGTRFSANVTNARGEPLLTISQPTALEFGSQPGSIINKAESPRGLQLNSFGNPAGLLVQPQRTLALMGGDIISEGGNLTALGGSIEVGAVGANSLVRVNFSDSRIVFDYQAVTNFADISFRDRDGIITQFVIDESGQFVVDANGQREVTIVPSRVSPFVDASSTFSPDFRPIVSGSINFVGGNIEFLNGSQLSALNFSDLPGGDIRIKASGQLTIAGVNFARPFPIRSGLLTVSVANGDGGNILLDTNNFVLRDQAFINSGASGRFNPLTGEVDVSPGTGGTISIRSADSVVLDSGASIRNNTSGDGSAGKILIDSSSLLLSNQATISSSASNPTNPDTGELIGVSQGEGGNISFNVVDLISLEQESAISSNAEGEGNAGAIDLQSSSLTLRGNSEIAASTVQSDGGNINVEVENTIELREESQISASVGGTGNGGNIDITTNFLLTSPQDNSDITASAELGMGGDINIDATGVFGIEFQPVLTNFSDLTVSSQFGLDGTLTLANPDLQSINFESSDELVFAAEPSIFIPNSCRAYLRNKYTITGRGGIPLVVKNTLRSEFGQEDWRIISPNSAQEPLSFSLDPIANKSPKTTTQAAPTIQGWYKNDHGEVVLTSEPLLTTPQATAVNPGC